MFRDVCSSSHTSIIVFLHVYMYLYFRAVLFVPSGRRGPALHFFLPSRTHILSIQCILRRCAIYKSMKNSSHLQYIQVFCPLYLYVHLFYSILLYFFFLLSLQHIWYVIRLIHSTVHAPALKTLEFINTIAIHLFTLPNRSLFIHARF